MSRRVNLVQAVLGMIALALVATLFMGGFVGGTNRDEPASPNTPGPATPSAVEPGARMPGVPERPIAEHETFPAKAGQNEDRLLDYEPTGQPSVDFLPSAGDLQAYASQVVDWALCDDGSGGQCATVQVPLEWEDPAGEAIEIAVRRVVDGDSSRGPLFVNPGGPGFGGQDLAQRLAGRWTNFDTIGWDPRGTGESTSVVCGTLEQTDEIMELDASPDDEAEDLALQQGAEDFAQQCRDSSGELLDHISTIDVVRDLDLLRHLLGAEKLNYVGVSYGTYVGAMYAQLFPGSVGRLVLDAAVDITGEGDIPQTEGFERAMGNFTQWCAGSDLCSLGDDQAEITDGIDDFLTGLDSAPLQVEGRILTQTMAATGIALYLYEDEEAYRSLDQVIANAIAGDGEALLYSADLLNGRGPAGYETIAYAFPAMACADAADEGIAPVPQEWRDTFDEAPLMAPHMGMGYTCQLWTAESAPQIRITAPGAPPILVVGTTGDSATPYEQAQSMAEQLESGTLLTLDGAGHGAVTGDNACIAAEVDAFLYDGVAPEDGKTCS
ncbi:MAG TPA: alpha/beta fold hydrolase [Arachnia sp.]|nr:alpha/beta fold hydrolase [Arachnia sp.]